MPEAAPTTTDEMRQALDRLAGHFASALGSLDPLHIDRAISDVLEQIAHALNVDHASLLGSAGEGGPAVPVQSWSRSDLETSGRSGAGVPVTLARGHSCALVVDAQSVLAEWPRDVLDRLRLLTDLMALARERGDNARELARTKSELARRLVAPAVVDLDEGADFEDIIGNSPLLRVAIARCQEVAPTGASVVLLGETGTGKELFARAVTGRSYV